MFTFIREIPKGQTPNLPQNGHPNTTQCTTPIKTAKKQNKALREALERAQESAALTMGEINGGARAEGAESHQNAIADQPMFDTGNGGGGNDTQLAGDGGNEHDLNDDLTALNEPGASES